MKHQQTNKKVTSKGEHFVIKVFILALLDKVSYPFLTVNRDHFRKL